MRKSQGSKSMRGKGFSFQNVSSLSRMTIVLEKERVYHWQFALTCDPERYVRGAMSVEPQEISKELLERLATASPMEKQIFI